MTYAVYTITPDSISLKIVSNYIDACKTEIKETFNFLNSKENSETEYQPIISKCGKMVYWWVGSEKRISFIGKYFKSKKRSLLNIYENLERAKNLPDLFRIHNIEVTDIIYNKYNHTSFNF